MRCKPSMQRSGARRNRNVVCAVCGVVWSDNGRHTSLRETKQKTLDTRWGSPRAVATHRYGEDPCALVRRGPGAGVITCPRGLRCSIFPAEGWQKGQVRHSTARACSVGGRGATCARTRLVQQLIVVDRVCPGTGVERAGGLGGSTRTQPIQSCDNSAASWPSWHVRVACVRADIEVRSSATPATPASHPSRLAPQDAHRAMPRSEARDRRPVAAGFIRLNLSPGDVRGVGALARESHPRVRCALHGGAVVSMRDAQNA